MLRCSPHVFRKGLDSKPQLKRDELRRRQNVGVLAQMTSKHNPSRGGRERGFTMAELLIVVAIIAVLVAIAVPVFSAQLEKSREAVDLANTRNAYAALQVAMNEGTLPDGTVADSAGSPAKSFFFYTDDGFVLFQSVEQVKTVGVKLVSSANGSLLSDFIRMPAEVIDMCTTNPLELKGCYLIAYRNEARPDAVLTLYPPEWLG